jgi:cob(I)alamin adenosyltransferase
VDELGAYLGLLISFLTVDEGELIPEIQEIQSMLFHIGARLSSSATSPLLQSLRQIREDDVGALERNIDRIQERLPDLTGFILPGGHLSAAVAHVSRAVCRRAERRVATLADEMRGTGGSETMLIYLNRLSDYLFVLARYLNQMMGVSDTPWKKT